MFVKKGKSFKRVSLEVGDTIHCDERYCLYIKKGETVKHLTESTPYIQLEPTDTETLINLIRLLVSSLTNTKIELKKRNRGSLIFEVVEVLKIK